MIVMQKTSFAGDTFAEQRFLEAVPSGLRQWLVRDDDIVVKCPGCPSASGHFRFLPAMLTFQGTADKEMRFMATAYLYDLCLCTLTPEERDGVMRQADEQVKTAFSAVKGAAEARG